MSNAPASSPGSLASLSANAVSRGTNAWLAVLSVAFSAVVFCTTEFLPIGLLRYISSGMHVSEGTAGLMVTTPGLLAAFAAPLVAVGVGRLDRRTVLLGLSALLVFSNLISMFAATFPVLLIGRVLFGIGLGGFWAVGAGIGGRLVTQKAVGRATSLIFAGVSIGMLLGGSGGALIGELAGSKTAFGAALALSVLGFLAQAAWLPRLPVTRRMPARELLGIVATPAGRIGLLAMLIVLCGQFAAYTYVTPFLAQQAHFGAQTISAILFGYTLIGLVGNFIGGHVAGHGVKTTLAATIGLFLVSVTLLPMVEGSQGWTLVLVAAWGLAYGAMPLALQMWMARSAPHAPEGGMALYVANFQASIALGSLVGGVIVDHLAVVDALSISGLLGVVSLLVLLAFDTSDAAGGAKG